MLVGLKCFSLPFWRFSLGVFCVRVACASRVLDILCVGNLEDRRHGRTSLFFDDSVASERVRPITLRFWKLSSQILKFVEERVLGTRVPLEMFGVSLSNIASKRVQNIGFVLFDAEPDEFSALRANKLHYLDFKTKLAPFTLAILNRMSIVR